MYFVRCLRKFHVDSKIISLFYNSVVSSVFLLMLYNNLVLLALLNNKKLCKHEKRVCKVVSSEYQDVIEDPKSVYGKKCLSMLQNIMSDSTHPLSKFCSLLPHGRRLNVLYCRTSRFQNSFYTFCNCNQSK